MSSETSTTVSASQKNDDGQWYYVITTGGEQGPKVGPYETEEEAIAAGEQQLAKSSNA
ncbi:MULTISPECIES: hypothetical protein [Phyllobacterium]|jgi:hypothetical protein|uniref:hypothetical protein n=1 Tax=Phyllobacterium TaxID=28100 RepID=UPI0013AE87CC|nr:MULTISPECIES: hypothetical protein [Phyllobacterium]UXN64759.1 hypothetical protein N8E89_02690 [Phyllobacterium sp. A18/5-2]